MDTLSRPEIRPGRIGRRDVAAYVLLAVGLILLVLGIYEVGGLFNVGLGLAIVWVGELVMFVGERVSRGRRRRRGPS